MSAELPLFDRPPSGEQRKRAGMDQVYRHTPEWYREAFTGAVESFPSGRRFTVEDVREVAGDPPSDVSSNCMGPLMVSLSRRGIARKTGFHVKAKRACMNATELSEWVRL